MKRHFYIDGIRVEVTYHAAKRYAERIRSLADPSEAELQRCVGEIEQLLTLEKRGSPTAPAWCGHMHDDIDPEKRADWYMLVGDDIAFPTRQVENERDKRSVTVILTTTLTRGGISDQGRKKRNARKQRRRMLARERRAMQSWLGENNRWN